MFKTVKTIAFLGIALVGLSACQTNGYGVRQTVGFLGGGAAGAWAGSQIGDGQGQLIATGAGAVIGALVGSEIGRGLDEVSRMRQQQTAQAALENYRSGQTARWANPDQGARGTVTPMRTYQSSGTHCREYRTSIEIGGQVETGIGTACRQPDGSWRLQGS